MAKKVSRYYGHCEMCERFHPTKLQSTWARCRNCEHLYDGGKDNWKLKGSRPLKTAVAAKTSLNKRSTAPKTSPKSRKPRLRTA